MRMRQVHLRIKVIANSSLAEGALLEKERRCLLTIVHPSVIRGESEAQHFLTNKLEGLLTFAAIELVEMVALMLSTDEMEVHVLVEGIRGVL